MTRWNSVGMLLLRNHASGICSSLPVFAKCGVYPWDAMVPRNAMSINGSFSSQSFLFSWMVLQSAVLMVLFALRTLVVAMAIHVFIGYALVHFIKVATITKQYLFLCCIVGNRPMKSNCIVCHGPMIFLWCKGPFLILQSVLLAAQGRKFSIKLWVSVTIPAHQMIFNSRLTVFHSAK